MQESSQTEDRILIIRATEGDAEAFGLLFDKYSKKIYRFIYYKVSRTEIAEDLTSQSFLKTWEHLYEGSKINNFQQWIYRVARNLVIDYYRSREKEELPLIYQEEEIIDESLIVDPESSLKLEELKKLLLSLKSDIREIVILKFIEDLSIKEIAKIVDKSPGNIRVIIHRAIKELKNNIKD